MRIAFYAPLKAPTHTTPSGDRRVARLLMQALELAGHHVELASDLRSYDGQGDVQRQLLIQHEAQAQAGRLLAGWRAGPLADRPDMWLTYHLYYKAPDWIGPRVCAGLAIPYVVCEASFAPKRATGAWSLGHESVRAAIGMAELLLAPTQEDVACLEPVAAARSRIQRLPPFLDAAPFAQAAQRRVPARAALAAAHGLDAGLPWLIAVGMMRPGDKLASYLELARALAHLADRPWQLLVVGGGMARDQVAAAFEAAVPGRAFMLGQRQAQEMPGLYASADLCVWPAVNEAYGMALLEAQACGLPVIACATRGVPEVVCDGETGLLVPAGDMTAFAAAIRLLLDDPQTRHRMGAAASAFVSGQRSLQRTATMLDQALRDVLARRSAGSTVGAGA